MTNGDKIRKMTDEELAEFIRKRTSCIRCCEDDCNGVSDGCYDRHLAWLKKEAPDETDDADVLDFGKVFIGASGFAKDCRDGARSVVDAAPTIDAVPVVRCEDCKYSEWTSRLDGTTVGYCRRIGNFISPDFYRADGKGKEKTEARKERV